MNICKGIKISLGHLTDRDKRMPSKIRSTKPRGRCVQCRKPTHFAYCEECLPSRERTAAGNVRWNGVPNGAGQSFHSDNDYRSLTLEDSQ